MRESLQGKVLQTLYAPWRTPYHAENRENKQNSVCVFCDISKSDEDDKNTVFYRDELCYCVMNKYPYSPGHFLVVPHIHEGELENLQKDTWLRMNEIAQNGVKLLKKFGADGVNMGINLGETGGAGIPLHLHLHLVPRWRNDINFISTIGDTRVYSSDFYDTYKKIRDIGLKIF